MSSSFIGFFFLPHFHNLLPVSLWLYQDAHEFFIATLDLLHRHLIYKTGCRNFFGFWFWLSGMFSLNWRINPPGIVPSSCTCIVDTIFTGKLQSDVVCQVLQNISIFSSISFTCRCVRVFRQQSILFGTFLLTCQQLLTAPPSPWTSAWTGSLRLNIWAQCPRSGW